MGFIIFEEVADWTIFYPSRCMCVFFHKKTSYCIQSSVMLSVSVIYGQELKALAFVITIVADKIVS